MYVCMYVYIYIHIHRLLVASSIYIRVSSVCCSSLDSEESCLVRTESPCVVLWRPEALACRALIPPEACTGFTPYTPSLGFEPETSCI